MNKKKIAVIGASGLVGGTLVERLLASGEHVVEPLIHSSGNAWRLARLGLDVRSIDLLDYAQVRASLEDCTHLVNCSRGSSEVMIKGLANVLKAGRAAGIKGVIHIGSVAVYGDPPPPESVNEEAQCPKHDKQSYAGLKAQQDEMVMKAGRKGLPAVILCPPNVSGPRSYFLLNLLQALRSQQFAFLGDGSAPCVLVDVQNLCFAIELALDHATTEVQRIFITDDEDTTWRQVIQGLIPLVGPAFAVESVSREKLNEIIASEERPEMSIATGFKHLFSSTVREALRRDPLWAKADLIFRKSVGYLGTTVEEKLRRSIEGTLPVPRPPKSVAVNSALCAQQLRAVRHSCAKAKQNIGYQPVNSFADSMRSFQEWYQAAHHMNSPYWELLRFLY